MKSCALAVLVALAALATACGDICTRAVETSEKLAEAMAPCQPFLTAPAPTTETSCQGSVAHCTEADQVTIEEQFTCLNTVAACVSGKEYVFTAAVEKCKATESRLSDDCRKFRAQ